MNGLETLTERIRHLEKLVAQYKFDHLTGLMGRHDFDEKFTRVFDECLFRENYFTLAMIDVDGLHNINETHGYTVGDKVIIDIANNLKDAFHFHQLFRIGGDEFCLIVRSSVMEPDEITKRLDNIDNCSYAMSTSNDYHSPLEMFKKTHSKLSKVKKKQKRI